MSLVKAFLIQVHVASIEEVLGIAAINGLDRIVVILHRIVIVAHMVVGETPIVQVERQVFFTATAFLSVARL